MRLLFGECVLDTETRQVRCAGQPVHLTPKAFELLLALLEQRPRVVPKAELQKRLWPDTHVLEANLPNLVAELRTAVGDKARNPLFVRTVHGFGYAFCGEAGELGPAAFPEGDRPFVYRLVWEGGVVALAEGEYLLGRHPSSVVPLDAGGVSRRHARLRISDGQAILEDLGSRNGTFTTGERLASPTRLGDGDEFRLGSVAFTFRVSRTSSFPETLDQ
ncbi:MAG TPA: FHA domain-containing protein [Vicinamibacteria bacterium]|nr:FHA domain-containing protein [Vicinamibacteria bacterium]